MRAIALILIAAGIASAQFDPDTVTIMASSPPADSGPDVVKVRVDVSGKLGLSLDDVLAALSGTGLTERNLNRVSAPFGAESCPSGAEGCVSSPPIVGWTFTFSAPLAKLSETIKLLERLRAEKAPEMRIWFSASGYGWMARTARQCAYPTLVSQARRHAGNLADAAGLRLGSVVAIADAKEIGSDYVSAFSTPGAPIFLSVPNSASASASPPHEDHECDVVVQFRLLR